MGSANNLDFKILDQKTENVKSQFVINLFLFGAAVLGVFFIYFTFIHRVPPLSILNVIYGSAFLFGFYLLKKKRVGLTFGVHFFNALVFTAIGATLFTSGGLKAPAFFWIPILAFSTMNLIGKKSTLYWLAAGLGLATMAFSAHIVGVEFPQKQNENLRHYVHYVHLVLLSLYTFAVVVMQNKLSSQIQDLREKVSLELYHKNKAQGLSHMISGLAHEINNPLAISLGYLQKIKRKFNQESGLDSSLMDSVERVEEANKRIAHIIELLQSFTQSHSERSQFLLSEAVHKTLNVIHKKYSESGIDIEINIPMVDIWINGSISNFQQIFLNLLSNAKDALDYTEDKKIIVEAQVNGNQLKFSVCDNGQGVELKNKNSIFDPFFTTKEVGQGVGLGLSISQDLAAKFNGELKLVPSDCEGAEFVLEIPINPEPRLNHSKSA